MITIIIVLFYSSLIFIMAMIAWKLLATRKFKPSLVVGIVEEELHGKFHAGIYSVWGILEKFLLCMRVFFLIYFYKFARIALHRALIIEQKLKMLLSKWYFMIKGKGVIQEHKTASLFLRNMAEYKKQIMIKRADDLKKETNRDNE